MASRRYNTYKFLYSSDLGMDFIRIQREYLEQGTNNPITPITQLFLDRVIQDSRPFEPKRKNQDRHALSYIETDTNVIGEFISFIPYIEADLIESHLQEILDVDRVICLDYKGELINNAK